MIDLWPDRKRAQQTIMIPVLITSILIFGIILSFVEHQIHKRIMHKQKPFKWLDRIFDPKYIFEAHAVRHHSIWYRQFDFEPDPEGRYDNIELRLEDMMKIFLFLIPLNFLFFIISPVAGLIFPVMAFMYQYFQNKIHSQIHLPKQTFFYEWKIFRWLAIHHYIHHQYTNKNYNVVLPVADYILGTKTKPRTKHIRELLRLGYIKPRRAVTEVRLQKLRQAIAVQRQEILLNSNQIP